MRSSIRFILTILVLVCITSSNLLAQANGDYNSRQNGNWNTVTTWQVYNAGAFHNLEAPGAGAFQNVIPTNASGIITMMSGILVTIPNGQSITADQIEYENIPFSGVTGALDIAFGGTLIVNNGAGDDIRLLNDFTTFASLQVAGTLQLNTGATLVDDDYGNLFIGPVPVTSLTYHILDMGVHIHSTGAGVDVVPDADWQTGSTCQINATSGTVPTIASTTAFHHFTWNGTLQSATLSLNGQLTTVNGDFTISSTNTSHFLTLGPTQSYTLTIGNDFNISGLSRSQLTSTGNPVVINVGRDFNISSTSTAAPFAVSFTATGTNTINVTRDFNKSNASVVNMGLATGTSSLNILGNFSHTGGTITKSSGTATINFNGATVNTFTNSATLTGTINFVVASLKTLNLGTSPISGTGNFTLNGTIGLGSLDASGALQTGITGGNVRVSGTRTYASGSTIQYNGSGAQFIGNGFPSGGDVNLSINNSNNVTLSTSLDIVALRTLNLTLGNIVIGTQTLTINGTVSGAGGIVGGALSKMIIGGTGAFGTLNFSGSNQLLDFTINRTSSGTVTLGNDLTILGTLTQTDGALILNGRTLTISGDFARTSGTLSIDASASIIVDGSGSLPGASSGITGSTLSTLTLNRASSTLTVSATVAITNLNLTSGTLSNGAGLAMATGGTLTRANNGSMTTAPNNTTNAYNVVYNINSNISTGPELPTNTTALSGLTKGTGSATLTLNNDVTVNGILTLSDGSFDAGSNILDLKGNFVSNAASTLTSSDFIFSGTSIISGSAPPTFGDITVSGTLTPSANFNINGNLANNGTLNAGSATTTFAGTTTISGSSVSSFNNVSITGTLTAPAGNMNVAGNWNLGGSGTFIRGVASNSVTFNGTTTFTGTGLTQFSSIIIGGTLTSSPTLRLAGNFTNNGTFNPLTRTVLFNGSSTQLIQGSTVTSFNNINITNSAGPPSVRVASNQDLIGVLTLGMNSIFDADGIADDRVFRLRSSADDPTVDASIATLPTGAQVQGQVTVQRYMSIEGGTGSNGRIYRYISSPVQSAAVSQIQPEIPVTGTFTGTSSCSGCGTTQSMFRYNETLTSGDISVGWEDFPDAINSETLQSGRGYSIFVRGNINPVSGAGSALWDVRGTINSGLVTLPSTFTVDGWNLVGNPYPSTIDWDAGGWTKTNINNATYMRDNGLASPVFATYISGVGTNGGTRYIPTGQAFWVRSTGAPSLQVTEAVKAAGTQTEFFKEGAIEDILRIKLKKGSASDEIVIRFDQNASDSFDALYDAVKFDNPTINLSSLLSDDTRIVINTLGELTCSTIVKLDMYNTDPGFYSLDFSEFESFIENIKISLIDNYTGATSDVEENTSYAFEVDTNTESLGNSRFSVSFSFPSFNTSYLLSGSEVCVGNDASVTIPNAEEGISYYATINGNTVSSEYTGSGSDLVIDVPNSNLGIGENVVIVMASNSPCNLIPLDNSITIISESIYQISTVSGASSCKAGSVTISADGAPSNGSYKWYLNASATESILGATGSSLITPILEKTETYYVAAVNGAGCEGNREAVVAEIVNYDDVLIEENEDTFTSSYLSGNQWYKDGEIIPGATNQLLKPEETGVYKVEVSIGLCSSSAERSFVVTGIDDEYLNGKIVIYPNPVEDILWIEFNDMTLQSPKIVDMMGRNISDIIMQKEGSKAFGKFDFRGYPGGVYLLQVMDSMGKVHSKRISKK